jgi:hypothetical protein
MTTDFTPTGTPLVNGMVDPQHPRVLWISRPDGKVEAYGYPPTDAGGNEWFAVTAETVVEVARMIMGKPT